MDNARIQHLIDRFNAQQLTAAEERELEQFIESGQVEIGHLGRIGELDRQIEAMNFGSPSKDLDDRFYHMLALEKGSAPRFSWKRFFSWPEILPKLAFASVALFAGIAIGYYASPASSSAQSDDMIVLTEQVRDLKEMMMLSLIEKESASERLKAVSLTQEMDQASTAVTEALIKTLNNDENVNVRLAALDALKPYVRESKVRQQIIMSIAKQESPLVQIAMAELMVQIQEKSSVKELEKIMKAERTPVEVKQKIKESIQVLS